MYTLQNTHTKTSGKGRISSEKKQVARPGLLRPAVNPTPESLLRLRGREGGGEPGAWRRQHPLVAAVVVLLAPFSGRRDRCGGGHSVPPPSPQREREASLLFLSRQHSRRPQGGRRASPHAQALPPFIRSFCLGLSVGSRAFALLAGPAHRPPSSSSSRRRRPRWGGAGRRQGGGAAPCWEEIKERPGLPHWLEKQTSIWSQARKSSNTCHILISRGFFEEKLSGGWMFDEPLSPSLTHPSKIQDKIKSEKLLAPSILDKEDSTCDFCL
ncbi:uncharacterized protein LOC103279134 [Anolis carolinensis]|uniref:uncharacterized protein LOC103279134 n=1 Tax=Anolis carolinensis TaxID=28377 RepID=UPI002F2B1F2A